MRLKIDEPMPFSRGLGREISFLCLSGAAVLFIFYLLDPFRFSGLSHGKLLGYGIVSVAAGILYIVVAHYLYRRFWLHRIWTLRLEIIHSLFFLLFIGVSIMIYGYLLRITDLSFASIALYLCYTVLFGFLPVTIRAVLVRNWRLKNDLLDAKRINELLATRKLSSEEKIVELQDNSSKGILKLNTHDVLYLAAAENYITIAWVNNNLVKKELIRMTMKDALKKLNDPWIAFCHRSFIINLRKVKKISSQAGISTIILSGLDEPIPLSTTHKKEIKEKLKELQ